MLKGYELGRQLELDKFRWLGTIIAQVGGAKKIKKPKDLMKLPLIDGESEKATREQMIEFLKSVKAGGG
jgi:hypothetical protein